MSDLFESSDNATPLEPDAQRHLKQSWITTRADLNEAEQANILAGRQWAYRSRVNPTDNTYLKRLHQRMFGEVWTWAGQFRTIEVNIGTVRSYELPVRLREFLDTTSYWIEHGTYPPDELVARYHHGLVLIHPFTNGNGRHTRLAADLLCRRLAAPAFTWGSASLDSNGLVRARYITALRAADRHDIAPLLAFARS
ncbi:MAG: mobile mystery protein B [Devosia sp.]